MSAVQPCLDSKEMATTSVEFLESFRTIDEEKDSDEESFHLFLDGDDELNKTDEKIQLNDVNDDANKNNDEEKEKVIEPTNDAIDIEEDNLQLTNRNSSVEREEKNETEVNPVIIHEKSTNDSSNADKCENPSEDQDTKQENSQDTADYSDVLTEDNEIPNGKEKNISECDNKISSNGSNDCEQMEIENEEVNEKPSIVEENNDDMETNSNSNNDEALFITESEDDILNKHAEASDAMEDLDPALEEILLDDNDEESEKKNSDTVSESSQPKIPEIEPCHISCEAESKNDQTKDVVDDLEKSGSGKIESKKDRTEGVVDDHEKLGLGKNKEVCDRVQSEVGDSEKNEVCDSEKNEVTNSEKNEVTDSEKNEVTDSEKNEVTDSEKIELTDSEINEVSGEKLCETESDSVSQKCDDNSNGSSPSDTEDLLDISMIKDSAQDDADIAEDALQLEQENEDSDGNGGNSKIVELVYDNSNLENSDEDGKEGYCSESQEASEQLQSDGLSDIEKDKEMQENEEDREENLDKEIEEIHADDDEKKEDDIDTTITSLDQDVIRNMDKIASKRPLSNDIMESEPKKIKLAEKIVINENEMDAWDITELQSLISFSKFMTKSHLKELTRADLEEFCIQKLCEAILHKSELGETNHQLKIQEQTIESLRKEQSVLSKQIKDLEIVNKKLMHEVKNHMGTKPIIPVKITRSVGLQVRMTQANDPTIVKRRSTQITPQKSQTPIPSPVVNNRSPRVVQNNTVNRQVLQKSPQKPNTPILSKVLQNKNRPTVKTSPAQNNTPARTNSKPKASVEKKARTSGSFIDLTDEDDKRTNAKNQNSLKTVIPQGVRINTIPKTTMSSVLPTVVSSSAPQVMYVVQSNSQIKQGLLTTPAGQQKAVLVNFQPTNGVIGSLNTSSVSVIPKVTTSVQLKTASSLLKISKHPAPLPYPPIIQGPTNKSLKGIPPKPELSIRKTNTGIILQWRMPYDLGLYEGIASYQLYAYQETSAAPSTDMWRKVGDVKAMALPMACTLTQFPDKNKYYFAVRPVDIHKRIGRFSDPEEISL